MKNIITRIAPSPTAGFCHIGNVRTLLYNYFLAKKNGGKFFVRLEDTDRDRYTASFLDYFKDMCDWLGIVPDGSYWNPDPSIGSFVQSERDYSDKVKFLLDNGLAYYAFDTKDELEVLKSKGLKYDATTRVSMNNSLTNPDVDITFDDAVLGSITINTNTLDDKVLIKSNGIGSYHLCNVCDDHDMGVSHVLRGSEWVNSTPFHVILYKAFGWDVPTFAHLPLIMNPDGRGKLSKRTAMKYGIPIAPIGYTDDNGDYVGGWKDLGFDPNAFINAISLIGWNPGGDVEFMSIDDMINSFSLDRVHKAGARFDMDKAKWLNAHYLRMTPNDDLKPFITIKDKRYSDDKLSKIIDLAKERSEFKHDLNTIVDLFFNDPVISDIKKIDENFVKVFGNTVDGFISSTSNLNFDNPMDIKDLINDICSINGIKMGKVMPGLRMALVGGVSGPDLMTTMSILGMRETISRLIKAITTCYETTVG